MCTYLASALLSLSRIVLWPKQRVHDLLKTLKKKLFLAAGIITCEEQLPIAWTRQHFNKGTRNLDKRFVQMIENEPYEGTCRIANIHMQTPFETQENGEYLFMSFNTFYNDNCLFKVMSADQTF